MLYHGLSEEELVGMCISMGLTMKKCGPTPDSEIITTPAVTLRPTSNISAAAYEDLKQKQVLWNVLIDVMARHPTFLSETLRETAESDKDYTGKMLQMYHDVYCSSGNTVPTQPAMLGIFRNDFMEDVSVREEGGGSGGAFLTSAAWKQVEINTISVSFAGLSPKVVNFQRQVDVMALNDEREIKAVSAGGRPLMKIADSNSDKAVPEALGAAAAHYAHTSPTNASSKYTPVVCFVVQEGERNTADQIALALEVERGTEVEGADNTTTSARKGVRCIRRTLMQLKKGMTLVQIGDAATTPPVAIIDGHYEVAVFYFRSCYAPDDFPTEAHWEVRREVELAAAIKCPSLPHYLCTYKKVQQRISRGVHEVVEGSRESNDNNSVIADLFSTALGQYKRSAALVGGKAPLLGRNLASNHLSPALEATDYYSAAGGVPVGHPSINTTVSVDVEVSQQVKDAQRDSILTLARWVESNFVPIYSLNPSEDPLADETLVKDAIANLGKYVLKPMLEGAGRIYAREEMVELLKIPKPDSEKDITANNNSAVPSYWTIRREYILMKRINVRQFASLRDAHDAPVSADGVYSSATTADVHTSKLDGKASTLLRHGTIVPVGELKVSAEKLAAKGDASTLTPQDHYSTLVSELGVYGVVLTTGNNNAVVATSSTTTTNSIPFPQVTVLHNKYAGYVVRSKPSSVEGGGVMAGAAFLDALQVEA